MELPSSSSGSDIGASLTGAEDGSVDERFPMIRSVLFSTAQVSTFPPSVCHLVSNAVWVAVQRQDLLCYPSSQDY